MAPVAAIRRPDVIDRILRHLALPVTPTQLGHADTVAYDVTGEPLPSWVEGLDPEPEPDARAPPGDWDGVAPPLPDLSNRPVNTATLAARYPRRAAGWLATWSHLDAALQLRTAVFKGEEFIGFLGAWRSAREGGFDLTDHARLTAALPSLSALLHARLAVRRGSALSITRTLDALNQPAFLVIAGTVGHANQPALEHYPALPEWLRLADAEPDSITPVASVTRLEVDGENMVLVVPRGPPRADPLAGLSPC